MISLRDRLAVEKLYAKPADDEIWYPIPSMPGYEFSSEFRLRSWRFMGKCFRTAPRPKIMSPHVTRGGYLNFTISVKGKRRSVGVAHIVAELAYGEMSSPTNVIRHLDDNPRNNYASNLAAGTPKDNTADAIRNGRRTPGTPPRNTKLNEDSVRAIRSRAASGVSLRLIGSEFGISYECVRQIKNRTIWSQVS